MALLWIDGFDQYGTTLDATALGLAQKYPIATVSANPLIKAGRLFGNSISNSNATTNTFLMTPNLGNMQTVIIGGAFYFDNLFSDRLFSIYEADGATEGFNLRLTSGGLLQAERTNTLLDQTGAIISPDTWYYIEVKVRIGNAGTGNYEVRVNGVNVLSDADADTQAGATDSANRVEFRIRISNNCRIDDVYICDGTGTVNNDFLGDSRVETIFPSAEGSEIDFTPSTGTDNSALVDDDGYDGDSTYVESAVATDKDLYTFDDLTAPNVIHGIQFSVVARKTDVTDFDIELLLDGNVDTASTVNSTNYSTFSHVYEENPDTMAPWVDTEINAAEFGYQVG